MAIPGLTRKRFHLARLTLWIAQLPLVFWLVPTLQKSLAYIIFLSIAALIESAGTDYDQARQAEREAAGESPA